MILTEGNEYPRPEIRLSANLSLTDLTWIDPELNPRFRGKRPT